MRWCSDFSRLGVGYWSLEVTTPTCGPCGACVPAAQRDSDLDSPGQRPGNWSTFNNPQGQRPDRFFFLSFSHSDNGRAVGPKVSSRDPIPSPMGWAIQNRWPLGRQERLHVGDSGWTARHAPGWRMNSLSSCMLTRAKMFDAVCVAMLGGKR